MAPSDEIKKNTCICHLIGQNHARTHTDKGDGMGVIMLTTRRTAKAGKSTAKTISPTICKLYLLANEQATRRSRKGRRRAASEVQAMTGIC